MKKNNNEFIPGETEKIATRRSRRLAEKLKATKQRLKLASAWRGGEKLVLLGGGLIFVLNLYLVWMFFGTEAFNTTYSGPVIPFFAKIISLSGLPLAYAIEIVNISFFLVFPVSFYWLVKKVSGKPLVALLSGLVVSLPISPFAGARAYGMFFSVEGPHIASLSIVPIAIYGLMSFLHTGGLKNLVLAALGSALVGLISPFGLLAYVIFAGLVTFSEVLLGHGRLKLMRVMAVLIFTGGICSFWYNPGFFWWLLSGPMGLEWREMVSRLIPISLFTTPILGVFGYLLFDRKPDLQPLFLGIFLTIAFGMIIMTGRGVMPSTPVRYFPEFGVALAFLFGVAVDRLLELRLKIKRLFVNAALIILVGVMTVGIVTGRSKILAFDQGVLGLWTGVDRGELWQAREQFGGGYSIAGYAITALTAGGTVFLRSKVKEEREKH